MSAAIFFSFIFICLLLTPLLFRLRLAFWTSVFQIYTVPLFGFYPSIALMSQFSLAPVLLKCRNVLRQPTCLLLLAIIGVQAVSLLWSPDIHLGLATILYELPFLILYIAAFTIALEAPNKLAPLMKCYAILSLAPLLTLFVFRFHFNLDSDFLQSSLAKMLINPNTLDHSPYAGNHVELYSLMQKLLHGKVILGRWLDKPHSFFMNPNTCAGYLGICSLIFWGTGTYFSSRLLKVIAVLDWLGLFLILSFSAMVFAIIIPILLILAFYKSKHPRLYSMAIKMLYLLILIGISFLYFFPTLINIILHKLEARLVLWQAAASFTPKHVLTGLGFGGWAIHYENYRLLSSNPLLQPNYPPHNTFIQLFFDSGLMVIILCLLFMRNIFLQCKLAYRSFSHASEKIFALTMMGAFVWVFLQGMGENWGFLGEMHIQAILAVAFALLTSMYYRIRNA